MDVAARRPRRQTPGVDSAVDLCNATTAGSLPVPPPCIAETIHVKSRTHQTLEIETHSACQMTLDQAVRLCRQTIFWCEEDAVARPCYQTRPYTHRRQPGRMALVISAVQWPEKVICRDP
jgi:hypothetical protein